MFDNRKVTVKFHKYFPKTKNSSDYLLKTFRIIKDEYLSRPGGAAEFVKTTKGITKGIDGFLQHSLSKGSRKLT